MDNKTLSRKLRDSAHGRLSRYREASGREETPNYIQLMFLAADRLNAANALIPDLSTEMQAVKDERNAAVRDLSAVADCLTCAHGPVKSCALKGECGKEHDLWQWRGAR